MNRTHSIAARFGKFLAFSLVQPCMKRGKDVVRDTGLDLAGRIRAVSLTSAKELVEIRNELLALFPLAVLGDVFLLLF